MPEEPYQLLSPQQIEDIHQATLDILGEIGVRFPDQEVREICKRHGLRTDGQLVFFTPDQIEQALDLAPRTFTLCARNPARDVCFGEGNTVFAPGYGAPFLIDPQEGKRLPSLGDYRRLTSLVQMLPNQDLTGYLLVEPQDVPPEAAPLYMLEANLLYADKPFIGSAENGTAARDTIRMAEILFGSPLKQPVTLGVISALSPLAYSPDMTQAVLTFARAGQPMIFANLVMAGSTGPITLAGTIAQQNAELLAGITLAQLVRPGIPVLYGTTSTSIDMRSGSLVLGGPELSLVVSAHAQLARYYGLPSRSGGALTDASTVDAQAGYESMFGLLSAVSSGIDFILHAAGILSSYLAFSYEKLILDDEICGMVRHYQQGLEVNADTLALPVIKAVGPGGHFLNQPQTVKRCRTEFWQPALADRSGLEAYWSGEQLDAAARAGKRWRALLEEYQRPALDSLLEAQIQDYLTDRLK